MTSAEWIIRCKHIPSDVEELIDILLENRNAGDAAFLYPQLSYLQSYMNIKNLDKGVHLLLYHMNKNHDIVVVGDYDCDGITSIAQLLWFFRSINYHKVHSIVPTRDEGYGIPERAVRKFSGAPLFIVVDCGTHDYDAVTLLKRSGSDVLVIDHHEIANPNQVAPATVLINPKQPSCPSRFKELCSSGLTLLFLIKLRQYLSGKWPRPVLDGRYQSLAAMGTIADVMPLVEANRIITKAGLDRINEDKFLPLSVLRSAAGIESKRVNAGIVGFYLAPRINAAGRVGDPLEALSFLTATDREAIERTAGDLNRLNAMRQVEEEKVLRRIALYVKARPIDKRTLVVAGKGWHPGVVGIVASRAIQRYHYGPVIVGTLNEDGMVRASGRAVPGFDMCLALSSCDDILLRWGGHEAAAGLTIQVERLKEFRERFELFARQLPDEIFRPKLYIDVELPYELITMDVLEHLELLEPHGHGNPTPLFLTRRQRVVEAKTFGSSDEHVSIRFESGLPAVFWRATTHPWGLPIKVGQTYDVIYNLEYDAYLKAPRMVIRDLHINQ